MPEGIWGALGAALSQGGRIFGTLTADENDRKLREDAMRQEQERYQAAQELQRKQFEAQERERNLNRIRQSIMDAPEGAQFDQTFLDTARQEGFGHLFNPSVTDHRLNVQSGLGGLFGEPGSDQPAVTSTESATRRLSIQEQAGKANLEATTRARGNEQAYRDFVTKNPNATAQQRYEAALQFGQKFEGLSPAEVQAQEDKKFKQRLQELDKMYPPDRFGANAKSPGQTWLAGYNTIVDNVRAKYAPQLNALARAEAEGVNPNASDLLARLNARIDGEAKQLAEQMLGPMPNNAPQAAPQDVAPTSIVDRILADHAAEIQANPAAFIADIKADPEMPEADKAEIIKRIMGGGAAPQSQASSALPGLGAAFSNLGGAIKSGVSRVMQSIDNPNWAAGMQFTQPPADPVGAALDIAKRGAADWERARNQGQKRLPQQFPYPGQR